MNGYTQPTLIDHLAQAKQLAANRLLRPNYFANVAGVGIGRKVVCGNTTTTNSIRIYVVSKLDLEDLTAATAIPSSFLDLPTDVIQVGRLGRTGRVSGGAAAAAGANSQPGSPIRINTNAPNVNQGRGTLGALVQAGPGPNDPKYILSCNHILALNGRVPADAEIVSAEFVGQQTVLAGPGPFVPLTRDGSNYVDCALARLKDSAPVSPAFANDTLTLSTGVPIDPVPGMRVKKVGAATGLREGQIVDIGADLYVDYSFGTFRFDNQIVIDSGSDQIDFATLGDSGSLVVDTDSRRATALIFAASGRFAVACPLAAAFQQLEYAAKWSPGSLSVVMK